MRYHFAKSVLEQLLKEGVLHLEVSILAVCADDSEKELFSALEFTNVTLSGLYEGDAEGTLAPFAWSVQDAQNLTFEDASFDFCFVSDGIHHCASPHRAILEMYRVSREGILVFDSRAGQPRVRSLNVDEVLGDDFFRAVEHEFSHALREMGDYPFAHLMNLTMHFEEAIREIAMMFILERLGVRLDDRDFPGAEGHAADMPTVVVYVVTGSAVSVHSDAVLGALRELLQRPGSNESLPDWERRFADLAAEESEIMQRLNRQELAQAVRGESPDYFALWDNLN